MRWGVGRKRKKPMETVFSIGFLFEDLVNSCCHHFLP
jgi:hypothetical protein